MLISEQVGAGEGQEAPKIDEAIPEENEDEIQADAAQTTDAAAAEVRDIQFCSANAILTSRLTGVLMSLTDSPFTAAYLFQRP